MEIDFVTLVVGSGFMGRVHSEALRRVGRIDVVNESARDVAEFARSLKDDHDGHIDAVHICTPNASHFGLVKAALLAGKHVICEKPLAVSCAEGEELVALARSTGLRNCTCHNLRYYPMVQQMRRMVEAGELGEILVVQGTYSQDWLLYETDWNWRIESDAGGPSRVMADIGSHWCDMAEHVTGLRITELCADLQTFHKTRKRPTGVVETFAAAGRGPASRALDESVAIETEDFGAVIFRMGARTRGAFTASQVSAGRKNRLSIEIYGTKSSAVWDQERPDELWMGRRDEASRVMVKDPGLMIEGARAYADLPGGHSEGYDDTFKQVFRRFYASIHGGAAEYPEFTDGLRQLRILDAELESNRRHGWVEVPA